eukprot:CAMPEP_0204842144 /NCGR_PEP_ID=MMETSP1346-20131115/44931_1 /ASSEMBLY_ACC=CAM_ASM_000771 /TAXON_ID=215587 /ORGANISM="Aplanochytrium stocchinoi, Strain GSBS06" /LENGTH=93 /DNA_ID=CAMNT_0051980729 /DNA_START=142 /DNA_END=423 /DNA_ORIENTATION=+
MLLVPGRMPLDRKFGYKVVVPQTDADDEASEGDHIGAVVAAVGRGNLDVLRIHKIVDLVGVVVESYHENLEEEFDVEADIDSDADHAKSLLLM